jgi:hypothetical protein
MGRLGALLCIAALAPLVLSGCEGLRRTVGLEKTVPNEFDVVQGTPLAIPPDFNLRPPKPGAPPTQDISPTTEAKEAIFRAGDQTAKLPAAAGARSAGEDELLRGADAASAEPDIRDVVNKEATEEHPFNKGFVDRLMFWRSDAKANKDLLDPSAESLRLGEGRTGASQTVATQFSAPPTIERNSEGDSFLDRLF